MYCPTCNQDEFINKHGKYKEMQRYVCNNVLVHENEKRRVFYLWSLKDYMTHNFSSDLRDLFYQIHLEVDSNERGRLKSYEITLIVLLFLHGLTQKSIATVMAVRQSTISKHLKKFRDYKPFATVSMNSDRILNDIFETKITFKHQRKIHLSMKKVQKSNHMYPRITRLINRLEKLLERQWSQHEDNLK